MGFDLTRRRDSKKWTCNNSLWRFILSSAQSSGWKPIGPKFNSNVKPNSDELENYCRNDGQTVHPEDAKNMHDSLKKFIKVNNPKGIEKEIIESFLLWVQRKDQHNNNEFPGFIIN